MKTKNYYSVLFVVAVLFIFSSCKKDISGLKTTGSASTSTSSVSTTGDIAIGLASTSTTTTSKDSLYLINCLTPHSKKDSVAFSTLPAAIGTYLTANYSGYTLIKSFKIVDSLGNISSYIVAINYNNAPVGLKFTASGTFVQVLEQRAAPDLQGPGFHPGGPFNNRNGLCQDTLALSAIPAVVKNYFTANYPTDTLLHASVTHDTTYILISKNAGLFATVISKTGTLIKRVQLQKPEKPVAVLQANLPAAILTYLTTTYPSYVFNKAFSRSVNGAIAGYDVLITANNTNYDVQFDASGTFIKAIAIH